MRVSDGRGDPEKSRWRVIKRGERRRLQSPSLRRHDPDQVLGVEAMRLLSAYQPAPPAKSRFKIAFWPNLGVGYAFLILEIQTYSSG